MINTKKKEETQTQTKTLRVSLFHSTANLKADSCSSEPETSRQNAKMCGAGTLLSLECIFCVVIFYLVVH